MCDQETFIPFRDKVKYLISQGCDESIWECDAEYVNDLYFNSLAFESDDLPY